MQRLKGAELLSYVQAAEKLSEKMPKAALVSGAGYGRGEGQTPAYTDFYEALLEAKGAAATIQPRKSFGLPDSGPAIYVACLASYNNGDLFGRWINLENVDSAEEIKEAIQEILSDSPIPDAEEYAIHDFQGLPKHLQGEWPDIDELWAWIEQQREAEDDGNAEPFTIWLNNGSGSDYSDFLDQYAGCHSNGPDFAYDLAEACGHIKGDERWPLNCIDWDRAWRELEIGGDYWSERGDEGLHVFYNC